MKWVLIGILVLAALLALAAGIAVLFGEHDIFL